jgi:two-component system chemotaxis response regulator CheB
MIPKKKHKILIVDDSVVVRGLLRKIIEAEDDMEVIATAINGLDGVSQYKNTNPDIVLMDIEMPEMNGIEALNAILSINNKARVIMCSSLTQKGAKMTFKALEQGAFDCLSKPTTTSIDRGDNFKNDLMRLLRQSKEIPAIITTPIKKIERETYELRPFSPQFYGSPAQVLAIGSSTGGPAVLTEVFRQLPVLDIPVFITQHMPEGFTKILADTLSRNTNHTILEAEDDMPVKPGEVYIARGGQHLTIQKVTTGAIIKLSNGPAVCFCKPSINVMLESILQYYKTNIITAILTGMGDDGASSCQKLLDSSEKNIVIAQDKTTSTVWGMPAAIAEKGMAHGVFPMSNIAPALNRLIKGQKP